MSVHRSISLWGVWYLQRKSTPKNEVLRLKTLDFWRLWKWRNWCDLEDLVFIWGIWSVKTFVFVVSFSLSWVIGNTVLLKGVEEILRKNFHVMLNSKSYTYQSLQVKPLEISYSSVNFFSDRDEVLLVAEECSDWGVRNSPVRIAYTVRNMIALRNLNLKFPTVAVLCASCPKISYPPNGHIIEGHLCLIMSGCSLGYK